MVYVWFVGDVVRHEEAIKRCEDDNEEVPCDAPLVVQAEEHSLLSWTMRGCRTLTCHSVFEGSEGCRAAWVDGFFLHGEASDVARELLHRIAAGFLLLWENQTLEFFHNLKF